MTRNPISNRITTFPRTRQKKINTTFRSRTRCFLTFLPISDNFQQNRFWVFFAKSQTKFFLGSILLKIKSWVLRELFLSSGKFPDLNLFFGGLLERRQKYIFENSAVCCGFWATFRWFLSENLKKKSPTQNLPEEKLYAYFAQSPFASKPVAFKHFLSSK